MWKLFLRLFSSGRLPPDGHRAIEADKQAIVCEGVVASITFRNFRSPGRYSSWRKQMFLGSIAVSKQGVIAYRNKKCLINIAFDDPRIRQVAWAVHGIALSVAFDAGLFESTWSGEIEMRFRVDEPEYLLGVIETRIKALCPT